MLARPGVRPRAGAGLNLVDGGTRVMNSKATEGLIHRYISDNGLRTGAILPPDADLATALGCDAPALVEQLAAAEQQGLIAKGWVVRSSPVMRDQKSLSFSRSAKLHGEEEERILLEAALRLPRKTPEDPITTDFEARAQKALGLNPEDPFLVIRRLRLLHKDGDKEHAGVIHRSFLDPKRFPANFLAEHKFDKESLIDIYNQCGYIIDKRYDTFVSRPATPEERLAFKIDLGKPVLDMEQRSESRVRDTSEIVLIEYLRATYWNLPFELVR